MIRARTLLGVAVAAAALTAPAPAGALANDAPPATAAAVHHKRSSLRIWQRPILGHAVRAVTWVPGGRVHPIVAFSARHRTVPQFAGAGRPGRTVAAINGMTWHWSTGVPVGVLKSRGKLIHRDDGHPAVGFYYGGGVVFGAQAAKAHGAGNIIAGEAYLVRKGVPLRSKIDAPYAGATGYSCGARGTDGAAGCFRSVVARFRGGRVGLVEIAFASMPQAAKVLVQMNVVDALALDSGGSANEWDRAGVPGSCSVKAIRGGCFGITRAMRLGWERQLPDAIVVSVSRP